MSLTGRRFGTFTVGELFFKDKKAFSFYFCKCDCGQEGIRRDSNIHERMRCRVCSAKRYKFEQRGEFDCLGCGGAFPLDLIEKSKRYYYYCPNGRYKKAHQTKQKRLGANKLEKEKEKIKKSIHSSLGKNSYKSSSIAAKYLGVDKQTFMLHISSLFREEMNWDKRSEFELDHVVPMSEAKTSEDIKKLWHYTNLQPLWGWENNLKSNRLDWREDEWAKELVELRIKLGLEKRVP